MGHRKARERALGHLGLTGCLLQRTVCQLHEGMLAGRALRHSQTRLSNCLGRCGPILDGLPGGDQVSFHGERSLSSEAGCYNPKALQSSGAVF